MPTPRAVTALTVLIEDRSLVPTRLAQAFFAGFGAATTVQDAQDIARRLLRQA